MRLLKRASYNVDDINGLSLRLDFNNYFINYYCVICWCVLLASGVQHIADIVFTACYVHTMVSACILV